MKYSLMTAEEIQTIRVRLTVIGGILALLFFLLLGRLWYLQVLNGDYYGEIARGNRIRVVPQAAPRGIIYDRNGVILAFNRPAFNVALVPEDTPNLETSLRNLSEVSQVPYSQLLATAQASRRQRKFKPIMLLKDVGRKSADLIETYLGDLPGISVMIEAKRLYPAAFLSSHVLGYVGVINEDQLKALPVKKLYSGRIVGQSGIESMLNDLLIGVDGGRQVEVDNVGRELRVLGQPVKPVPGHEVTLTIDLRLQRQVRTLMAGYKGVVIVMKPRTGEILAMNSFPDYDPNLFVGGIEGRHWSNLIGGDIRPLFNKATQGQYAPGSTFKMVLAAAGLDLDVIDPDTAFNCPGYFRINREIRYCWNRAGHGDVNLRQAIAQSCNVFFYKLGQELGVDHISQYAELFGFGQATNVELDSEQTGLLPTKEWKRRVFKEKWYLGETVPVSIGQGYLTVTPLQLINYVNVIANRGMWVKPTVILQVIGPDGNEMVSSSQLPRQQRVLPIPVRHFDALHLGMIDAVEGRGTARRSRSRRFAVAGKTGTSQIVGRAGRRALAEQEGNEDKFKSNSLYVAYAPAEDPQVTILVLVEQGGSGSATAAPVGKKILEFYDKEIEPFSSTLPRVAATEEEQLKFRRELNAAFGPSPILVKTGASVPKGN